MTGIACSNQPLPFHTQVEVHVSDSMKRGETGTKKKQQETRANHI